MMQSENKSVPDPALRMAASADYALISSMAADIWKIHYTPILGESQVAYMLKNMYSSESLSNQTREGQTFYIIEENKTPAGFISISHKNTGEYFLHKFYLDVYMYIDL